MPTIDGLTKDQVKMLDFMWNELDSEQDFLDWYDNLSPVEQQEADLLQRLVIMGSLDDEMAEMTDFPDARRVIQKVVDGMGS